MYMHFPFLKGSDSAVAGVSACHVNFCGFQCSGTTIVQFVICNLVNESTVLLPEFLEPD